MRNDSNLKALRPKIETEDITTTEIEKFQNQVLRPILKFQHSLLEIEVENNPLIEKLLMKELSSIKKRLLIKGIISKPELKNQLLGQITGLLTNSEYLFYFSKKKEIDKRIFSMLMDRILSVKIDD
jgi:hypothetical protein